MISDLPCPVLIVDNIVMVLSQWFQGYPRVVLLIISYLRNRDIIEIYYLQYRDIIERCTTYNTGISKRYTTYNVGIS